MDLFIGLFVYETPKPNILEFDRMMAMKKQNIGRYL